MTKDEILKMDAGDEIDALVTELILKYEKAHSAGWYWNNGMLDEIPSPSYDIADAWKVVSLMRENYFFDLGVNLHTWTAQFTANKNDGENFVAKGQSAALAICRAALLTTIGEEK